MTYMNCNNHILLIFLSFTLLLFRSHSLSPARQEDKELLGSLSFSFSFSLSLSFFHILFSLHTHHLPLHTKQCETSSVGQSAGLSIMRSPVQFWQNPRTPEKSSLHGFELYRTSSKVAKLLFQVIKTSINLSVR